MLREAVSSRLCAPEGSEEDWFVLRAQMGSDLQGRKPVAATGCCLLQGVGHGSLRVLPILNFQGLPAQSNWGNSGAHITAVDDSAPTPLSPGSDRLYHQWLSTVRVSVLPTPATCHPHPLSLLAALHRPATHKAVIRPRALHSVS